MDVHQASISIAVRDASGKLVMESLIETKAATILEFLQGLKGTLWVTFEEGTRRSRICVNIPGMGSARAIRREQDAKLWSNRPYSGVPLDRLKHFFCAKPRRLAAFELARAIHAVPAQNLLVLGLALRSAGLQQRLVQLGKL